jgi:hypothetical protein
MAGRPCTFVQHDLVRALLAAKKAGIAIQRFEIENGKITVVTGKPEAEQSNDLDKWMEKHDAH